MENLFKYEKVIWKNQTFENIHSIYKDGEKWIIIYQVKGSYCGFIIHSSEIEGFLAENIDGKKLKQAISNL
jgi:hypothetical protein